MEFIDKHNVTNASNFKSLVDGYIAHGKVQYKELSENEKDSLKTILRNEQSCYCAFCMQKLEKGTVEHVIPQGISRMDFGKALHKGNFYPTFIHQSTFNAASTPRIYYPHTLAYGNVVCSCNSCNSKKWDELIAPTFFNNPTNVSYKTDGIAVFPASALSANLKSYLNESLFRRWRSLWCAVKQLGIDKAQIESMNKMSDRKKMIESSIKIMPPSAARDFRDYKYKFLSDKQWSLFVSYSWFWDYYSTI